LLTQDILLYAEKNADVANGQGVALAIGQNRGDNSAVKYTRGKIREVAHRGGMAR